MNTSTKQQWPDLTKDAKALELAKVAMGWSELSIEQQMDASRYLMKLAQEFKESL